MIQGGPFQIYHNFKLRQNQRQIDLANDQFKCALLKSTYVPDLAAHANWADISAHEVAAANGYAAGGVVLTNPTLALTGGVVTWDTDNALYTANGGSITARLGIIYDNTHADKALVAYCLLDEANADVLIYDGVSLALAITNVFSEA